MRVHPAGRRQGGSVEIAEKTIVCIIASNITPSHQGGRNLPPFDGPYFWHPEPGIVGGICIKKNQPTKEKISWLFKDCVKVKE